MMELLKKLTSVQKTLTSATGKPVLFLTNVSFDSNGSSVGVDPVSPTPIAASILYNIAATWEQVSPI